MNDVREFLIDVDDSVQSDLRDRLSRTRFAAAVGDGWDRGTDANYLAEFVRTWESGSRWQETADRVNQLSQVMVRADGADIHVRAPRVAGQPDPIPLVLTHGWPSSFFEFLHIVGPLTDPARHGGDPADAFDVIIPSLPGFGFSSAYREGPTEPARIANTWTQLMTALDYDKFGAYGGDIGSHVTNFLGANHPDKLIGVFTHHPNLHPVVDPTETLSQAEEEYLTHRANDPSDNDYSYADVQAARPNSLAPGLSDFPAGLAAWMLEKYREWSDCAGDLEAAIDRQTLLDIVNLYWVTNSIGTSFLPYVDDELTPPLPTVTVPAGIILTPEDAAYPREYAARTYSDIRLWRGAERGGHFLALENPERLVRELREFFRPLRSGESTQTA